MDRPIKALKTAGAEAVIFKYEHGDAKMKKETVGHADIQTTMNRYVHQQSDTIVETGKRVTDLFVQKMCKEGSPQSLAITGIEAC